MIRVKKNPAVPASLQINPCTHYDGQDVQDQLIVDQEEKCYLCEQKTGKHYEIEHLRPKADDYYPQLKYDWNNLFLGCNYCNKRKPNRLQLLDPTAHNVEETIEQRVDFNGNKVLFISGNTDSETKDTIELLDRLHNGINGLRDRKTQVFYKDLQQQLLGFMTILSDYQLNPSDDNKQAVIDSLSVRKEFLGLKYWLIKDNAPLFNVFKSHMVWNKQY